MDLDAYFARIGYDGPRAPTLEVLRAIHAHHPRAIPFENLDVLLGRPIRLDAEALVAKLVHARRGGYCFEQNGLLEQVLSELGFEVTPLAGRVRWQVPPGLVLPRTHKVLRVDLDGVPWLVDVGFGGLTPTTPLRLDTDGPQATPLETMRITASGEARTLQARTDAGWGDVYAFTLEEQHPVDFEMANWFTSTHPTSRFKQHLIVARADVGARVSIFDGELTVRRGGSVERRPVGAPDDLLILLRAHFGLDFPGGTTFPVLPC